MRKYILIIVAVISLLVVVLAGALPVAATDGCCGGCQGCTPGFWKNNIEPWASTGYSPDTSFNAAFGTSLSPDITLLQALQAKGGGIYALERHCVAALLNVANPDVNYHYSGGEVISMTQDAISSGNYEYYKDLFEAANTNGCPIDAHGLPIDN